MTDDTLRSGPAGGDHASQRDPAVSTPSFDAVFDLLASSRRRYALYVLLGADEGVVDVTTLADEVAMREARAGDVTLSESRRESVAESLRETHLPRLAEADVVDFDPRSGAVRYWPQPTLEEYLEHTHYKEFDDA